MTERVRFDVGNKDCHVLSLPKHKIKLQKRSFLLKKLIMAEEISKQDVYIANTICLFSIRDKRMIFLP